MFYTWLIAVCARRSMHSVARRGTRVSEIDGPSSSSDFFHSFSIELQLGGGAIVRLNLFCAPIDVQHGVAREIC